MRSAETARRCGSRMPSPAPRRRRAGRDCRSLELAAQPSAAIRSRFLSVRSRRCSSPTRRPWLITMTRSQTSTSSSTSVEASRIAWPCAAELGPDALDLAPRADIDAARRVDHDEDARIGGEPARDLHLLLVAAGQRPHLGVDRRGLDLQRVDLVARPPPPAADVEQRRGGQSCRGSRCRYCRRSIGRRSGSRGDPAPSGRARAPRPRPGRRSPLRLRRSGSCPRAVPATRHRSPALPRCSRRRAGRTARPSRPCGQ